MAREIHGGSEGDPDRKTIKDVQREIANDPARRERADREIDLMRAEMRLAAADDRRHSLDEVLEHFGYTREQLGDEHIDQT